MEPNYKHRSVQMPDISVQGNEAPIYMDCTAVVSSVLASLSNLVHRGDGAWLLDQLEDIHALLGLEARGMTAADVSADAKISELLEQTGTPVLEMSAGTAIQYAKRLEDAADSVSSAIDKDTRYQFKLREARKMVEAAAVIDRHPSLVVRPLNNIPDPAAVFQGMKDSPLASNATKEKENADG